MKNKLPTRKDVAEKAGVSLSAVTKILNNTPGFRCRQKTREQVILIAEELGYNPGHSARSLKQGKTNIIGLLLPTQDIQFHNRYYSEMVSSLVSSADSSEYYFLYLGQNTPEKYEQAFRSGILDGLILLQSSSDPVHLNRAAEYGKPVVTMNFINNSGLPEVSMDYEQGIREAYIFLSDKGSRSIGFLTWDIDNQPVRRFRNELDNLGPYTEYLLPDEELKHEHITKLLDSMPDGIIIDDERAARFIIKIFREEGIIPGKDVNVALLSDTPIDFELSPNSLLLESQPLEVGREAWNLMHKALEGDSSYIRKDIPYTIKIT